jgi:hypothetical protein
MTKSLLSAVLMSAPLFAQLETSEVLGTVRDNTNSGVPMAMVTLTSQDTGIENKTTTDESGNYDFANVKVGVYTVTVEHTGFSKASAADIVVNVGSRQRVDITLQVGVVTETVNVASAATLLETDTSEHGQVINTRQIVELPLNGRSSADLALLSTNVHRSAFTVAFATNATPREGSFNANGTRSTYNNFLLDGLDNNAYSTSNQGFTNQVAQLSPDALAEFRVITSNFSAEYGRVGGAVVSSVMRSGSNDFHGNAFEFLRNTDLNAIGYIFGARPATFTKPTLQRNQFGFSIGGPFIKNKLFFFADYEGFRQLSRFLNFDSIPNMTDRAGILPDSVVNPRTGAVYPANTQIPLTAILPFAYKVLNDLPAPNGPGRTNDYQALLLVRDYADRFDAKIDGQINAKMSVFARFSQRKDNAYFQPDIPGPSGGAQNGYVHAIHQGAAVGYTWSITPASLFEARLGFAHILGGKNPPYLGGPSMQQLYGIPGLPTDPKITGGLNTQSISGFNSLGRQSTNPQFQNPTSWDPKFNYTFIRGRHSVKLGYEFETIRTQVNDINPLYGLNTYSGQFSKPAGGTGSAASYNLADFMFGLPSQLQLSNLVVGNYRQHLHAWYVQHDFRVNSKLTLNLGLRWEFATPRWERDNVLSNFDPTTNKMITASDGSLYNRTLVDPDYSNWEPRVGLAYSIDSKTVLRGGYGISHVHFNRVGSADELGINGPQVIFGLITQSMPAGGPVPANFITTEQGYPAGFTTPANFNPLTSNNAYIPRDTKWPYIQTWVVSIQRELLKNTVLEVAYNGNHSLRLPIISDYNQAFPNLPGQSLGVQARRPIPSFSSITWVNPAGQSSYNGLSVRVEHRFGHGLYFLNSFTWSKAMGNSEQALENFPSPYYVFNPQNIRNLAAERAPVSFDVKLINVASVVYELPFGRGKQFGGSVNRAVDLAIGGWALNTIVTANTGVPIDVTYAPSAANDVTGRISDFRGVAEMRPNVAGDTTGSSGPLMLESYWNKSAFATPLASAPFGNLGRNAFRGPGLAQWDLSVNKTFRFTERFSAQLRSEFFNVLNHTNFGLPDPITTDAAFGTIRTIYPPRQIQFGLKVLF